MGRHFHLLVQFRGERHACLTFRKVANWYCRVLRPGREVQQCLVRLESVAEFDRIVEQLRQRREWDSEMIPVSSGPGIAVPRGPIEHW